MFDQNTRPTTFVPTQDFSKSRRFYQEVLGLNFLGQDDFALTFEVGGLAIRVSKVGEFIPSQHPILGWEVDDVEFYVRSLTSRDVKFERYDFLEQNELGIWSGPGGSRVAFFKDLDGNLLTISSKAAPRAL